MPGSQAVHLAVAAPGASQSALRHHGAEIAAGHDVGPRHRRGAAGLQIDRILVAVVSKAAHPVEVRQLQERERTRWCLVPSAGGNKFRLRGPLSSADQLLLQRSAIAAQHHAGRAQEQIAAILRDARPVAQKYAARPVHAGLGGVRLNQAQQLLPQRQVVAGAFLIQNNQVHPEVAPAPVRLRQQQLANQRKMAGVAHRHRQHRKIAGDPVLPQTRLPQPVARQPVRLRTHARVGIEQMASEFLEAVRGGGADAQIAKLELGAGPGQLERPPHRLRTLILRHQRQQRFS